MAKVVTRAALAVLAALAPAAFAADEVPYVRTPQTVVDAMLELGFVRGNDFVIDLGSGDGRIVITAARKYGARGLGLEYDKSLVRESAANARKAGVADRVRFVNQNIFEADLSSATVLTMYLLPDVNLELRPKILAELRPGTRVVSHDWDMADWEPDAIREVPAPDKPVGARKVSKVYLWIVPARIAGRWRTRLPLAGGATPVELDITQRFQELAGRLDSPRGEAATIEHGLVRGPFVLLSFPHGGSEVRFEGSLKTDRIVGRVTTPEGRTHPWRALRVRRHPGETAKPHHPDHLRRDPYGERPRQKRSTRKAPNIPPRCAKCATPSCVPVTPSTSSSAP